MKIFQNPQPFAVEGANKSPNKPSNLAGSKHKGEDLEKKLSNKEIYKTKDEESAWKEVLDKDKANNT
ncbi:hypothetical protein [Legionella hackeliae]|uniref:Uncharacterized protein n=1 Tax=Legionella hackeliae TaxID=449 RepID=A0A0A8ULY3_LEGHA|nr:hypothetical protein [Legionella hackeliae]KTD10247.1 hypothetical protein Lhac_2615 [Legionella hackeliae]CEK09743.1 protein of unknown function [Legionella hackeliae]STX49653.1 Uncharacterised protein [Legionella hackeliae]